MTETNKLKPCPFCRCVSVGIRFDDPTERQFVAQCDYCLCRTDYYDKESEARAAWNRRAVPAPQWTTELPTQSGQYWLIYDSNSVFGEFRDANVVHVSVISSYTTVKLPDGNRPQLSRFHKKYPNALWCPATPPPLPTQEDAK